ncbi:MAG: polysaccharide biosynthesis/export family protein [Muribaculaceae bacterium]|jgi:polysaccharide export outer membrane protein|nr:polysaccharide biosynthesis/export family protein [Muribaculaceae bacterium]
MTRNRSFAHILLAVVACTLLSCSTTTENNLSYFKSLPATSQQGTLPTANYEATRIAPDDELAVTISSSVPQATAMFNAPLNNTAVQGENTVQGVPRLLTHIVDKQGCIELPVIGKLTVAGMTAGEAQAMIKQRVAEHVRDPYVSVQLMGYYVNVMGEVKQPQRLLVTRQRFTVLDALAACGDLTEYGERASVLVMREENGATTYHRMNLLDTQLFSSPYFYLRQNDVVYVEPNTIRIDNSKYNMNNAYKLSVISTVVSATSVVASLIIALAVK